MEHENLLDKVAFFAEVQKALEVMGRDEADTPPADAEAPPTVAEHAWLQHLQTAAQKLLTAREVLYPVVIHWLDLRPLTEASLAKPLPSALELGVPINLIASGSLLETMARTVPEKFSLVKAMVEKELVEVCGGTYRDREESLLPFDSQLWNIREGLEVSRRLLGKEIRVHARQKFGFHPKTTLQLSTHGITKLVFLLFDEANGIPTYNSPVVAWTSADGKQVDAFTRAPKSAAKAETFFNLAHYWYKSTKEDHHATICLLSGDDELPWHRDLIALARLGPVLGTWTTLSRYLAAVTPGEYPAAPVADDFHHDLLSERTAAKLTDPVSGFVKHLRLRRRIDACWTYAGLHRALCGKSDTLAIADHLESLERVFETQPTLGVEPGGLVELEQQATAALAERLQARAKPDQPGYLLLNPCAFARRYALELDGASAPLPVEGIVKACQLDGSLMRAVIEVPALGFAWIPRSGPPGTRATSAKIRVGEANILALRNEFFEIEVDAGTGGLKAIRDHKSMVNRLGQKLVFNPGSRPVARKVEVTATGPALGEIVSEGVLLGDQGQELATFKQRFRVWIGRPLLEMRIELTPTQPCAGYPWHAYYAARFAWRDERTHLYRGVGGSSHHTTHPRPQTPDYLDLRIGHLGTTIFPGGMPFHQKQEGRMLDIILIPEGETSTTFDLGIALDRDQPMLTAWGLTSPLAIVPTTKGPPHVGSSGWLFHLDMPNLLLTRLLPGGREKTEGAVGEAMDAVTAQILECAGQPTTSEFRCVRNPTRAVALNGAGQFLLNHNFAEDVVHLEVASHDWSQLQVDF